MSHEVSFTGQITPDQVPMIAENGFKTIINNRPDGEEPNQPTSADIEAAAKEAGLAYKEISFAGNELNQTHVEAFADFFNQAEQPMLIFCRTGNRSNGIYEAAKQMDLLDD
ncbi:TIGR01244 family phosphatase [Psychrobacter sp. NG254]|uniref:TIGR01244 family sulfur transferase n=1 Tax=unclassified Psychrobacter TaxID=196806 RepID=UPI0018882F72|nr:MULTISPECIES: TIGR01244 family sulfur transferase [unclassified Psychrobacter]MBF2720209.1 TIGR01244 family phosphatase [Psychrobacter sp. NG254]MBH0006391.1 TIGR01244 family phosphatase [Psychrobacter sp. SWN149]